MKNVFRGVTKKALLAARKLIARAQHKWVTAPAGSHGFGVRPVLPFDSRQNIYDRDVDRAVERLKPSRGESSWALAKLVNESLGRKELPETVDEQKDRLIEKLTKENARLLRELNER